MNDPGLVIFDCDGTLVDSQHMIARAMDEAFVALNMAAPGVEVVRRIVGLSLPEAVSRLVPDADTGTVHKIVDNYKNAFFDLRQSGLEHEPMFPGMRELLIKLNEAGHVLAVATGKSDRGMQKVIELHDLHGLFHTVETADRHPSKPDPSMVLEAAKQSGIDAEKAIVVGDTVFDMHMAVNAKSRGLGVGWGYHEREELLKTGASHVADSADDIMETIKTWQTTA